MEITTGAGAASIASHYLVGKAQYSKSVHEIIDILEGLNIDDNLHEVNIMNETIVLNQGDNLSAILRDVEVILDKKIKPDCIFTINHQEEEEDGEEKEPFHLNITSTNLLDAAALLTFCSVIKSPTKDQLELLGLLCSSMKSRPTIALETLLFLANQISNKLTNLEICNEPLLNIIKSFGDGYLMAKKYDEALVKYRASLRLADQLAILGMYINGIIAKIYNNIGLCLKQKNCLEEAITAFTDSLVYHILYDDKTIEAAVTLNNLASCYYDLRRFDHALNLFQRSYLVYEGIMLTGSGSNVTNKAALVDKNIALCLMEKGRFNEALEYFTQFLDEFKDQDKIMLAKVYDSIGYCHSRLNHPHDSLKAYKQAHKYRMKHYGQDQIDLNDDIQDQVSMFPHDKLSEDISSGLNNIGNSFFRCGDHAKALEHFKVTLDLRKKIYGQQHLQVASTLYSIGLVYKAMGLLYMSEAHQNFQEALSIVMMLSAADPGANNLAIKIEQAMQKPTARRGSIAMIVEQAMQKSLVRRQSLAFIDEQEN